MRDLAYKETPVYKIVQCERWFQLCDYNQAAELTRPTHPPEPNPAQLNPSQLNPAKNRTKPVQTFLQRKLNHKKTFPELSTFQT